VKNEDKEFIREDINKKNTHLDLFISSYKIIKNNLALGTGTNQFYVKCKNFKEELLHCENHSHNLYLNIFSEQGLIIFIFFFYIIYKYVIINLFLIKKNKAQGLLLITILIILNPLSVSGDLFSTWTGTVFWYILGFYTFLSSTQKSIK
jgi:O-antigen ligase